MYLKCIHNGNKNAELNSRLKMIIRFVKIDNNFLGLCGYWFSYALPCIPLHPAAQLDVKRWIEKEKKHRMVESRQTEKDRCADK